MESYETPGIILWSLHMHYVHKHTRTHALCTHTCVMYTHVLRTHTCVMYTHMHFVYIHVLYTHTCIMYTHMHYVHTCVMYTHMHFVHIHVLYTHTHTLLLYLKIAWDSVNFFRILPMLGLLSSPLLQPDSNLLQVNITRVGPSVFTPSINFLPLGALLTFPPMLPEAMSIIWVKSRNLVSFPSFGISVMLLEVRKAGPSQKGAVWVRRAPKPCLEALRGEGVKDRTICHLGDTSATQTDQK